MDSSVTQVGFCVKQCPGRKSSTALQDLWTATREGSIPEVDAALSSLKKINANVDTKNAFGLTALHIAVWRNHVPIVRRLITAGADVNVRDGESGWTSLHRALHFGHLAVAGVLIDANASLALEDSKGRIPADYVSGYMYKVVPRDHMKWSTELFSWGNGANYQLGTGNARIQKSPCKVDVVQGFIVTQISAAKFHSVALTDTGELYTWGFGRGGRLGHPEFDIHSGQAAVITPRQVSVGLGQRRIKVVAAAKHHTIAATFGGDVFTWGTNREGQLGYTSVDTQPTPRRVSLLKATVIAVAAANKHSAAVTDSGEIFTWGCNKEGQLGYGTCNSASNYVPRVVESLKSKHLAEVSAAKHHTLVLSADGEVFSWGYKVVTPRRVMVQRNTKKCGNLPLKFHRMEKLHVVKIAAGWTHSTALTDDGSLFYWISSDPNLQCKQLHGAAYSNAVAVSAGKFCTSFVTSSGDIYGWDGKDNASLPIVQRIHGIKHAISVSVGYNHFLAVSAIYTPKYISMHMKETEVERKEHDEEADSVEEDDLLNDSQTSSQAVASCSMPQNMVPSLKDLCQKVAAESLLDTKSAIHLLDVADLLEAEDLRAHCEDFVLRNLDYILTVSPAALASVSQLLLSKLEKSLDAKSSEPWSHRQLPTRTATFPAVIDSEEDDHDETSRSRSSAFSDSVETSETRKAGDGFLCQKTEADHAKAKQLRAIRKKLQQIEMLELRQSTGKSLDDQQKAKINTKYSLLDTLSDLESGTRICSSNELNSGDAKMGGKAAMEAGAGRRKKGKKKGKKAANEHKEDYFCEMLKGKEDNAPAYVDSHAMREDSVDLKCPTIDNQCAHKEVEDSEFAGPSVQNNAYKTHPNAIPGDLCCEKEKPSANNLQDQAGKNETANSKKSLKKKSKKGGLSVFLSGALDTPKVPNLSPPPRSTPAKANVPAWGGVKIPKQSVSLLEIQSEQIVESTATLSSESNKMRPTNYTKLDFELESTRKLKADTRAGDLESDRARIPSSKFVRKSAPIAITTSNKEAAHAEAEKSTPPWAGTPPLAAKSSLREIQMQQVKEPEYASQSFKVKSLVDFNLGGFNEFPKRGWIVLWKFLEPTKGQSTGPVKERETASQKSPVDSPLGGFKEVPKDNPSRWFKPDVGATSSLRCIQIEEMAMKDLRRLYKNVKLVKKEY